MNQLITDSDSEKYFTILKELNKLHENIFTIKELCHHFEISNRKLIDFKKGEVIDFWLLTQYARIIGKIIDFYII